MHIMRSHDNERRKTSHFGALLSRDPDHDFIVDAMLKILGQNYGPPYHQMGYQKATQPNVDRGPYACGICVGPNRIE